MAILDVVNKKHIKMKIKISILLFLGVCINCKSQDKNCSRFKTGTFSYVDSSTGNEQLIKRNDSLQYENIKTKGITIITTVEWTSDCEYVLTYKDILNYKNKELMIGRKIYSNIIETNGNEFKIHSKSDNIDTYIDMIKIE